MYTPHTVSLYNTTITETADYEETTTQHITVLRGVFLDHVQGVNLQTSGLVNADRAVLHIPLSIVARNAVTGQIQHYVSPAAYAAAADKSCIWTLSDAGSFFVKGEVAEADKSFEYINSHYDNVYRISRVDLKDFGTYDMQHYEVGGA